MTLKNQLEEAMRNKEVISLYTSEDEEFYSVGIVAKVDSTHVCLESLTGWGESLGYEIRALDEIYKIEASGRYEKKIAMLNRHQGGIFKKINIPLSGHEGVVEEFLRFAIKTNCLITIWMGDTEDSLTGYISSIAEDLITISLVDGYGDDDGVSIVKRNNISSLDFGTKEEQVREFINKKKLDTRN